MGKKFKGISASPGLVIGKAFLYLEDVFSIPKYDIENIEYEKYRFFKAIEKTKQEIKDIEESLNNSLSGDKKDIYKSLLMMLDDKVIIDMIIKELENTQKNIEWVLYTVLNEIISKFKNIESSIFSERTEDISAIGKRLMRNLLKKSHPSLESLKEESILFCRTLSPTDAALLKKDYILGIVTEIGGEASHMAIMARALNIPTVLGVEFITSEIKNGDIVILNSSKGEIIINPSEEELEEAYFLKKKLFEFEQSIKIFRDRVPITLDGRKIEILSNIEILEELQLVKENGSSGIGLFRSEFLVLENNSFPDEEYQYKKYKQIFDFFSKETKVIIRTLDLGGDKVIPGYNTPFEKNPFLGWRAIRFCLERLEIFKTQLRAILRAGYYSKNLYIMIPMITNIEEVIEAKKIIKEVLETLRKQNIEHTEKYKFGIMVEVPSIIFNLDNFAKECDFFSIGTNDLIQYLLACDRGNEKVAYLFKYSNPAVIKALKIIIDAAHRNNIEISMCGEMASDVKSVPILIGLGLKNFSISPIYTNELKKIICSIRYEDCKKLVETILQKKYISEVEEEINKFFSKYLPDLII
ncbi:MAG: phosphoenolpyruvate--protein phosphotransferase [Spirochaetes bacterium]|nr:phosphoenolpyruvate--protein phosphotransferase [Spirochaetota bacterium]